MSSRLFVLIVLVLGVVALVPVVISVPSGTPDDDIGLAKGSVFEVLHPEAVVPNISDPGDEPVLHRAFLDAPPLIPHGISEFLPISLSENQCIECHAVEEKEEGEPTPIPETHFRDLRNAPETLRTDPAGARYVCTTCHVTPTRTEPLVGNEF